IFSNGLTELEKTTLSNRSKKLFTLSAIYQATSALLNKSKNDVITIRDAEIATTYWSYLGYVISEWRAVLNGEMKTSDLRNQYVHAHGVVLHALGIVGQVVMQDTENWESALKDIDEIDWRRSNIIWQGRTIIHDRISKSGESVSLTTILI